MTSASAAIYEVALFPARSGDWEESADQGSVVTRWLDRRALADVLVALAAGLGAGGASHAQGFAFQPEVVTRFETSYPELLNAIGIDDIGLQPLSDSDSLKAKAASVIGFPFLQRQSIHTANHYVLYAMPCVDERLAANCLYLEIKGGFGGAIHRVYGPIALPPPTNTSTPSRTTPLPRRETDLRDAEVDTCP